MAERAVSASNPFELIVLCWARYSTCRAVTLHLLRSLGYDPPAGVTRLEDLMEELTQQLLEREGERGESRAARVEAARRRVAQDMRLVAEVLKSMFPLPQQG